MTAAEELVLVDEAIARALIAQENTVGDQTVRNANLETLYKRKDRLTLLVQRESSRSRGGCVARLGRD